MANSRGRVLTRLLPDDVVGVPVRPVLVVAANPLLVLAVRRGGAPERSGEFGRRGERGGLDAPRPSHSDLLQQPAVAVGIVERGERAVAGSYGIETADAAASQKVGL